MPKEQGNGLELRQLTQHCAIVAMMLTALRPGKLG